jgi:hypothetical protein
MRTTITLEDDVAQKTREAAAKLGRSLKQIVNEALRTWLELQKRPAEGKPFRTQPRPMGVKPGLSLDNVQELLSAAEGEEAR